MKKSVRSLAALGLVFITFLASIQYIFLANVPDSVSSFSFVFITNVIGVVILFAIKPRHVLGITKKAFLKGSFFAFLLTGFNVFVLLGSHNMNSVVVSSLVSLYFVFVPPILLLLRKKVNFFSSIATVLAIIALLLIFGGNVGELFSSREVVFLVVADLFFAAYVVSVSILGEGEDSSVLTFSQMSVSAVFSLIGWGIDVASGKATFSIPTDARFWISAVFIGVFIRAVYGLLQITCQKYVSAIGASLIFSTEIIMTMIMSPLLSKLLGTQHTPATVFQVIGAVILIIATLVVDDTVIAKLGYEGMGGPSVSKKMVVNTISFSMGTLILASIIAFASIYQVRYTAVTGSTQLGEEASDISSSAMIEELERNTTRQAHDKAKLAEDKLDGYSGAVKIAANFAASLFARPRQYPARPVEFADAANSGKWTMQLILADRDITSEGRAGEIALLGNMEDVFSPIVNEFDNILTIYVNTEDGVMISYDRNSELGAGEENRYYEYRTASWYTGAKESGRCSFTDTYWDAYGRGLTITCVAPFYGEDGAFLGCVAMDILMKDLNESMVSEGIVEPTTATMIDGEGDIVASGDIDPAAQNTFNIFEENGFLKPVAREILDNKEGIIKTGEGDEAIYVTYATVESTGWKLCIISPVLTVIEPANEIRESIDSNTDSVVSSVLYVVLVVIRFVLILTALILIIVTLAVGKASRRISDPLKQLEEDVRKISGGNLENRTSVDTDDEIGSLAQSFNHMTESLQQYMTDLKEATAREERIAGELSAATRIQISMLPGNFEEFNSSRSEFELYADMSPAKEVGGDFYDFFMIDEDHLALVMADVSGKGIPAALFMVRAKTMIKNGAMLGGAPSDVVSYVNDRLCEGNDEDLFVTVWFGILTISTGHVEYVDAGHEYPALCHAGGKFEASPDVHSVPVATMEGMRFKTGSFDLIPGDILYLYTDGVTEANDPEGEMFGMTRLMNALDAHASDSVRDIDAGVREAIAEFVKDEPQFDDTTSLVFKYFGA